MVINIGIATAFFLALLHGQSRIALWGAGGIVFDCLPQGFTVGLMSVLPPSLITMSRIKKGNMALQARPADGSLEWVTLTTHNGTHLDAPWHFHPTMDGGQRAITIDEVPLEWCFAPGVKLDFRHFADGYVATAADVEAELKRIGHDLQSLDIVLVNTAAGGAIGNPNLVDIGCGMGYEATMYLLERGVRVTGTDAWSWDAPFTYTAKKVEEPAIRR